MKEKSSVFSRFGDKKNRGRLMSFALVIIAYIAVEVLLKTGSLGSMFSSLLVPITCYSAGIPRLIIAIFCGAILAAVFGFLIGIPVLKLQGDYLAIVTLAFGQIIKSIFMNAYIGIDTEGLHFSFVESNFKLQPGGKMLLNGPMGATGTQKIANFTVGTVLVIVALLVVYNLMFSRSGRAIMAARDNRIAAESVGIPISRTKMLAFVTSAALAGAAGALYGLNYSTLVPNKFDFNVLILLPELLRSLQDYRMLIYAVVLILIMLVTNNEWLMTKWKSLFSGKAKGGA